MKTLLPRPPRATSPASTFLLAAVLAVSAFASPGAAEAPAEKSHTLFMGADISVERDKEFHRVQDVVGGSLVLKIGGKEKLVPLNQAKLNLRVQQSLKITEASAAITGLKGDRTYTGAADPRKKFASSTSGGASAGNISSAGTRMADANIALGSATGMAIPYAQAAADAAQAKYVAANNAERSDMHNTGMHAGRMAEELGKELFDAMEVVFEVASAKPLAAPYVVMITRYRELGDKPDIERNWIFAQALDPIGATPTKVRIFQGGFPAGFKMENYEVHLYNKGEEVATNISPKRVPLSRDEAFQYLVIEHIGANKGATLPAAPAMGVLPADFRTRLTGEQLAQPLYVKVSKDGQALEVFDDYACAQKTADAYLQSLAKTIRYKPALEKGKAVEGIARLELNKLTL